MKIRIKFSKYGVMRFIGHLDMMRYFQKAMRRAEIDIAYTEGFSPHQIMSFAAPLGTGLTSDGEYLDIEVRATKSSKEALEALNQVMADGVWVTEYKLLPEGTKNAMSSVVAADYLVYFKEPSKNPFGGRVKDGPESGTSLPEAIEGFLNGQEQICITKQTKKSERTMDLKPLIYEMKALEESAGKEGNLSLNLSFQLNLSLHLNRNLNLNLNYNPAFFLRLCTGSTDNVKPELVLQAFFDYCRKQGICSGEFDPLKVQIHRLEVYTKDNAGTFVPLGTAGREISDSQR